MGLILQVIVGAVSMGYCQGWVGETNVTESRPTASDVQPCIATDGSGTPWIVWSGYRSDASLLCTRWLGNRWDTAYSVGPDSPPASVWARLRSALAFDGAGQARAVWDNAFENNTDDIGTACWEHDRWSAQMQVNLPDSTELDYIPRIECGGGRVWCVWYGRQDDNHANDVFASSWDSASRTWTPEMRVNVPDGNVNYNPDVAVDNQGRPHAIWLRVFPYRLLLYSVFDGQRWSTPLPVNDTSRVRLPSWIEPHIAIDKAGGIHALFAGVAPGADHRDVFHARLGATGWLPAQQVNREDLPDVSWCDIAAGGPDIVWGVWDRYASPGDPGIYAARFDGASWSAEERLDTDSDFGELGPMVCIDSLQNPWVVWCAYTRSTGNLNVYSNHYALSAVQEPVGQSGPMVTLHAIPSHTGGALLRYDIPDPAVVRISVVDGSGRKRGRRDWAQLAGSHEVSVSDVLGTDRRLPGGIYFCRLQALGAEARCKVVLLPE